jgi:protein ImuB
MLGPESVFTAVLGGGRGYADRVRLVPWGDERAQPPSHPWPGRLPAPAPATVLPAPTGRAEPTGGAGFTGSAGSTGGVERSGPEAAPVAVAVRTADGAPLRVDERLELTGPPATVQLGREPPQAVTGWAGPWPVQERWWAPEEAVTLARLQVGLADGRALLVAQGGDAWWLEAIYD